MFRFLAGTLGVAAFLAALTLPNVGFFDAPGQSQLPALSNELTSLTKAASADDLPPVERGARIEERVSAFEQRFAVAAEHERLLKHKLEVSHIFLVVFLICTAVFLALLAHIAFVRSLYGITFSDRLTFMGLLGEAPEKALADGRMQSVRERLGVLAWMLLEVEALAKELGARTSANNNPVMLELARLFHSIRMKLSDCGVVLVNPRESELTELGRKHSEAEAAAVATRRLLETFDEKKAEHERLTQEVEALLVQKESLLAARRSAEIARAALEATRNEIARRERLVETGEHRQRMALAANEQLRGELRQLMQLMQNWDESTDGGATNCAHAHALRFPRLALVARSWLRRTNGDAG